MSKFIVEIELSGLLEIEAISSTDAIEKAKLLSIDDIRDNLLYDNINLIEKIST